MDTYNTLVTKANSQSKQLRSLLQSQLALYDNFDAEFAVNELVQPKLQAVKMAEPALETKVEAVPEKTVETVSVQPIEPAEAEIVKPVVAKAEKEEMEPPTEPEKEMAVQTGPAQGVAEQKQEAAPSGAAEEMSHTQLFARFKPRNSVTFNRNGFPRKNADLRVALSELQKKAEPKPQGEDVKPEDVKPEENKES